MPPSDYPVVPTAYAAVSTGEDGFSLPDADESREFSAGEIATVSIIYSVEVLNIIVLAYAMWRSRTFKPLKARQLPATAYTLFSASFAGRDGGKTYFFPKAGS